MPYVFDDAGLEIPTLEEILKEMLNELVQPEAFGSDFEIGSDSPVYKLYVPVAIQLVECWQGVREVHANRDPESASGTSLAGLGSFAGIKYRGATASTIRGRVVGDPGTQVPSPLVLRYVAGKTQWQLSSAPVIGPTGTVEVEAFSLETGPVDADPSGIAGWEILVGAGPGIIGFESLDQAQLGEAAETSTDFRLRLLKAARGLATYDSIVREVSEVKNVSGLIYYQNEKLTFDPVTGLQGKQAHLIIRGGAKLDILKALHRAVGAPLETVGAVTDTVSPGNGQVLKYSFSRLKRRRGYLRVTINGGNVNNKLPDNTEALALAAIATKNLQIEGSTFVPFVYGQAAVAVLPVGSVGSMVAEGRLDPGDPWTQLPIQLPIDEQIDVATSPQPAEFVGTAEDPINFPEGFTFMFSANGGANQFPQATKPLTTTLAVANDLGPQTVNVTMGSIDGRFYLRTILVGATASLTIGVSFANPILGLTPNVTTDGTDGDAEIIVNP